MPNSLERIFALVESLAKATTLEDAVRGTVGPVAEVTESVSSGIVVTIHGGVFLEAWHPEMPTRSRDLLQPVRSLALQTALNGTAGFMPLDGHRGAALVVQAVPLLLSHRLQAALCVVTYREALASEPAPPIAMDRLGRVLALRFNELVSMEAERRKSQQYERWFRVSDRQIRALDLERQKFAALVNSFSGGAFVSDRDGVISWQSRPLLDRSGTAGDSWVGLGCRELCESLGARGRPACGECLVGRVLDSRGPISCEFAAPPGGAGSASRVVAAPINDLAGHAQEVIVTFQEAPAPARDLAA